MCGIYGYLGKIKEGKEEQVYELIKYLAIHSESRGIDATGFVATNENELVLERDLFRASIFVEKSRHLRKSIVENKSVIFIGHNRAASIGSKDNIENAHPHPGEKWTLVHNGSCSMAHKLAKKRKVFKKMKGTTDSEAVMWCIEKDGFNEITLSELNNYSIVALNYETGVVWFARDRGRPMFVFDLRDELGIRVFCSEVGILEFAANDAEVESMEIPYFSTKPFHIYTADYEKAEFDNLGEYKRKYKTVVRRVSVVPDEHYSSSSYYFETFKHNDKRFNGKKTSYSNGWSGGKIPTVHKNQDPGKYFRDPKKKGGSK